MIRIYLVDDHEIVRDGIKSLLQKEKDFIITGEAGSFGELLRLFEYEIPDLILMDISLPDKSGIEIARYVKANYSGVKIIMLSMHINNEYIFNSLQAGANAYLPKNSSKKELIEAIRSVVAGEDYLSSEVSDVILKGYLKRAKGSSDKIDTGNEKLTNREEEILKHVVEGKGNKEIAESLFISVRTVESHKNHIMQKLEIKSTVELIKYAINNNYINLK